MGEYIMSGITIQDFFSKDEKKIDTVKGFDDLEFEFSKMSKKQEDKYQGILFNGVDDKVSLTNMKKGADNIKVAILSFGKNAQKAYEFVIKQAVKVANGNKFDTIDQHTLDKLDDKLIKNIHDKYDELFGKVKDKEDFPDE